MIIKPPFTSKRDQEERDKDKSQVFTIRLNLKEIKALEEAGVIIEQEKLSTVIKQLTNLGLSVLHWDMTRHLLNTVLLNKQRNERIGIQKVEPKFKKL